MKTQATVWEKIFTKPRFDNRLVTDYKKLWKHNDEKTTQFKIENDLNIHSGIYIDV